MSNLQIPIFISAAYRQILSADILSVCSLWHGFFWPQGGVHATYDKAFLAIPIVEREVTVGVHIDEPPRQRRLRPGQLALVGVLRQDHHGLRIITDHIYQL